MIVFLVCYMFGNSFNPDGVCCFSYLKQPFMKTHHGHFPDNVKIHQAQIVKEWLGWSMKNHYFSLMNWHL